MSAFNWPVNPSVTIPGPTEFVKDGANVTVNLDTGTPANSRPLPVSVYGSAGVIIDFATSAKQDTGNTSLASIDTKLSSQATAVNQATEIASLSSIDTKLSSQATAANQATEIASLSSIDTKLSSQATAALQTTGNASLSSMDGKLVDNFGLATAALRTAAQVGNASGAADFGSGALSAQTLRVVLPTDQPAVQTKAPINTNGSNVDSTVSTVATLTVPANAVGFILMNLDTSSANIRWRIGSAATASVGQQLQAGRDTGYIPCAANISICAESGTQNYNIQWILSA